MKVAMSRDSYMDYLCYLIKNLLSERTKSVKFVVEAALHMQIQLGNIKYYSVLDCENGVRFDISVNCRLAKRFILTTDGVVTRFEEFK
jgi:hypothetical protein